jgi:hypothetical protein
MLGGFNSSIMLEHILEEPDSENEEEQEGGDHVHDDMLAFDNHSEKKNNQNAITNEEQIFDMADLSFDSSIGTQSTELFTYYYNRNSEDNDDDDDCDHYNTSDHDEYYNLNNQRKDYSHEWKYVSQSNKRIWYHDGLPPYQALKEEKDAMVQRIVYKRTKSLEQSTCNGSRISHTALSLQIKQSSSCNTGRSNSSIFFFQRLMRRRPQATRKAIPGSFASAIGKY